MREFLITTFKKKFSVFNLNNFNLDLFWLKWNEMKWNECIIFAFSSYRQKKLKLQNANTNRAFHFNQNENINKENIEYIFIKINKHKNSRMKTFHWPPYLVSSRTSTSIGLISLVIYIWFIKFFFCSCCFSSYVLNIYIKKIIAIIKKKKEKVIPEWIHFEN
jgi:hypothetical protein